MQRRGFLRALVATVAAVNMPSLAIAKQIPGEPINWDAVKNEPQLFEPMPHQHEPMTTLSIGKGKDFENVQEFMKWVNSRPDDPTCYTGELYETQYSASGICSERYEKKTVVIQPAACFRNGIHFMGRRPPEPPVGEYFLHRPNSFLTKSDMVTVLKRLRA